MILKLQFLLWFTDFEHGDEEGDVVVRGYQQETQENPRFARVKDDLYPLLKIGKIKILHYGNDCK